MINIEHFWANPKGNLSLLNQWREARKLAPITLEECPHVGIMIMHNEEPIAAGFLRNAEGVGIIDSIVSNPEQKPDIRHKAINAIFERLISVARMMEMKRLLGTSVDSNTIERSKKFGFVQADHALMIMSLGGE